MLNIGPGEVLVILVIALVVLGPSRLPATARTMGRILAKTRHLVRRFQEEMQAAADAPIEALARERARLDEPLRLPDHAGPEDPAKNRPVETPEQAPDPARPPDPDDPDPT